MILISLVETSGLDTGRWLVQDHEGDTIEMVFSEDQFFHRPVLYHEIIHVLQPRSAGLYVDCTLGAAGHAWGILQASAPDGHLLGLEVDPQAIQLAEKRLASYGQRITIVRASYTTLRQQLEDRGWRAVHGVILDLGVSSMQLNTPERGFSFQVDAPLDMRFDPDNPIRAVDLVNTLTEAELADILFLYGEERRSYQIARKIVQARPVYTTRQLADLIAKVTGSGRKGMHPATRSFQALRIAVNRELEALEMVLPQAVEALAVGGRVAVISFHSLEDRIVKRYFRRESQDCLCPARQPVCTCGHRAIIREITRRPIQPEEVEVLTNPRARSARLRVAEKIGNE